MNSSSAGRPTEIQRSAECFLTLAEGLDVPGRSVVSSVRPNPFLERLAVLDTEERWWPRLAAWFKRIPCAEDRLREVRENYYRLFLRPGAPAKPVLTEWFDEGRRNQVLVEWRGFLAARGWGVDRGFRNGEDHLAVVLEGIGGWLLEKGPEGRQAVVGLIEPWWERFVAALEKHAGHPYYEVQAEIAREAWRVEIVRDG